MAKKEKTSYRDKSEQELEKAFLDKKEKLRKFRFESSGARTTNVREAKNLRKDTARILTELRGREIKKASS